MTIGRPHARAEASSVRDFNKQRADLREYVLDELANYQEPSVSELTDPSTGSGWYSPLWQVVRETKAHPLLRDLDGYQAWSIVSRLVDIEEFLCADSRLGSAEDVAAAWADAHDRIRYLPGETRLDLAVREADSYSIALPRERGGGYARFVATAACYSVLCEQDEPEGRTGRGVIAIPVERWAKVLGVQPNTLSSWRRWAVTDGILEPVKPHSFARRRAAEYRIRLDLLTPSHGVM